VEHIHDLIDYTCKLPITISEDTTGPSPTRMIQNGGFRSHIDGNERRTFWAWPAGQYEWGRLRPYHTKRTIQKRLRLARN